MNEAILTCYELAASCLPSTIVATVLLRKTRRKPRLRELTGIAFFVAYITAVLHITGAGTLPGGMHRGMPRLEQCNFIPFLNGTDPLQCLLNVALFVPFGCFLATAFNRKASALNDRKAADSGKRPANRRERTAAYLTKAALIGFAFSLAIEASQLLTNRVFDVDDLIMNTFGAAMGCAMALIGMRIRQSDFRRETALVNAEPKKPSTIAALVGITAAVFLGRFLLFDEMGAAAMLYGF
ncbi:MAG: VanZ family protein [Slackia sp.]|nr:VanZ family protein [Slackia sp.]